MRTGGCTVQQALTSEAVSVVKQAVFLAKRRGHAQVTPLHVANTMLTAPAGLLRTACLQSHSHPLQCKALELCFNVALNRLPASNSSPMLGPHQSQQNPSISNALVAAFKRAQAHQRRGSIENQQQPLLAVKIELEQLIISILDDPSVSRVMREAGFSSTQVKTKVEQAVSIEISSQTCATKSSSKDNTNTTHNHNNNNSNLLGAVERPPVRSSAVSGPVRVSEDDIAAVINDLAEKRKRSVVVVGECVASLEGVVEAAIGRIEKREVPDGLKEVKFINLSISSFRNRSRVEVDQKVMELKNLIRSCLGKGVILYVGDIKWTIDYRASNNQTTRLYYCPVEHMIMELGKLAYGNYVGDHHHHQKGVVWIMGIATFQTYMRCKSGNPSLETLLAIHPLTIPAATLKLSLIANSDIQSQSFDENKQITEVEDEEKKLSCCGECSAKFEAEARSLQTSNNNSDQSTTSSSPLPAWLQQYKNEQKTMGENDKSCVAATDLYRKWNSICNSIHKNFNNNNDNIISSEKSLSLFSCILPNSSSSASGFSYDHHHKNNQNNQFNFLLYSHKEKLKDHPHFLEGNVEPKQLRAALNNNNNNNNNHGSTPSSTSSGSDVVMEGEYVSRFKELNSENFKRLCSALEKKVPWQKNVVGDIASAVLQCRSGMGRRKGKMGNGDFKEETWLLFQGNDLAAKEKVAAELARVIFGSQTSNLVSITLSSFSSTRADSTEDCSRNKRSREEQSCSYIERFAEAVSINPHRVFLVEDVEQADYCSQMGFKRAIEGGKITNSNGQQVTLADAIVILSCESFSARSRACSPPIFKNEDEEEDKENDDQQKENEEEEEDEEIGACLALDLNISIHDDHDDGAEDQSIDDVGLLDSVDRRIIFQIQEL